MSLLQVTSNALAALSVVLALGLVVSPFAIPVVADEDHGGTAKILNVPQVSGLDAAAGGALLARGGNASAINGVGGDLQGAGGSSSGTGAGTSVDLQPGSVVTGVRGRVLLHHPGPNTDRLFELATTGASGASVNGFVSLVAPETVIVGNPGDVAFVDAGTSGAFFVKGSGVGTNTGWLALQFPTPPLQVNTTGSVTLTTAEQVLMTGNITLPASSAGRVYVAYGGNVALSTPVIGTDGASFRLRVNGSDIVNSTRTIQQSALLAVSLTTDSQEVSTSGIGTCTPAVSCTIEVLAVKTGGVGTAAATGQRRLDAFQIN